MESKDIISALRGIAAGEITDESKVLELLRAAAKKLKPLSDEYSALVDAFKCAARTHIGEDW